MVLKSKICLAYHARRDKVLYLMYLCRIRTRKSETTVGNILKYMNRTFANICFEVTEVFQIPCRLNVFLLSRYLLLLCIITFYS